MSPDHNGNGTMALYVKSVLLPNGSGGSASPPDVSGTSSLKWLVPFCRCVASVLPVMVSMGTLWLPACH